MWWCVWDMGEVFDPRAIIGTGFYPVVISQQALIERQITCKPVSESHTIHLTGQNTRDEGRYQVKVQGIWLRGKLPYFVVQNFTEDESQYRQN